MQSVECLLVAVLETKFWMRPRNTMHRKTPKICSTTVIDKREEAHRARQLMSPGTPLMSQPEALKQERMGIERNTNINCSQRMDIERNTDNTCGHVERKKRYNPTCLFKKTPQQLPPPSVGLPQHFYLGPVLQKESHQ